MAAMTAASNAAIGAAQLDGHGRLRHLLSLDGLPRPMLERLLDRAQALVDEARGGTAKFKVRGRAFAINADQSVGKPVSAGLIFVSIFCVASLIFVPISARALLTVPFMLAALVVVVRLAGTNEEEGAEILKRAGLEPLQHTEDAVRKAIALAAGGAP